MKNILIIGNIGIGKKALFELMIQNLKEKYGDDIKIYTPDEAQEKGLKMEDFENVPTMKVEKRPELFIPVVSPLDLDNSHPFQKFIGKPKDKRKHLK
jgi:hypothetical protein